MDSEKRKYAYLPRMWDFCIDKDNVGIEEGWYKSFPEKTRKMPVPSCWNTEIDLFRYMGTAWYKTELDISEENIYIGFDAVQNEADVYLDGVHLGSHYGGFLHFGFEVTGLSVGRHTLVVRVNNEVNSVDTFPLELVDWYNFGGIARDVHVIELPDAWISDYKISYKLSEDYSSAILSVNATVRSVKSIDTAVTVSFDGRELCKRDITVSGEGEVCVTAPLDGIRLWDIDSPELYYVKISLSEDDIIERIGFRDIRCEGKRLLLNGKPLKVLGVNRHEEHPDISGGYIWQFADNRGCVIQELGRPRGFNNKGILDEYRRPKRAYRVVRRLYGELLGHEREHYKVLPYGYKEVKGVK